MKQIVQKLMWVFNPIPVEKDYNFLSFDSSCEIIQQFHKVCIDIESIL